MRGRRFEKTAGVAYDTRPPQARQTRSFPREYVEGGRCDE